MLARPGGRWWCSAMTYMLNTTCFGDQVERFAALSDRYITCDVEPAAEPAYVTGVANLVSLHGLTGSHPRATAALRRLEEVADRHLADSGAQGWRALARSDYHRAIDPDPQIQLHMLLACRELFSRSRERRTVFFADCMVGQAQVETGLVAEGEATLRVALALAVEIGEPFFIHMARIHLAAALSRRTDEASQAEAAELALAMIHGDGVGSGYRAWAHGILAQVRVQQGALAEAEALVQVARKAPSTNALRLRLAAATLMSVWRARGALAEALALAESELAWLRAAGGAGYVEIPLRLAVAEVLHAAGDRARAREQLAVVRAAIDVRAARITDPAWRARFIAEVPDHTRAAALARAWSESPTS
jgi:hypothetical protein